MKIVPFPRPGDAGEQDTPAAKVEAALSGESGWAEAASWRELRADVRGLAPPMSPEFEQRLRERIVQRAAAPRDRKPSRAAAASARIRAWLRSSPYRPVLAGSVICVLAAIVALVIVIPQESGVPLLSRHLEAASESGTATSSSSSSAASGAAPPLSELRSAKGRSYQEESKNLPNVVSTGGSGEESSATSSQGTAVSGGGSETARVQQLGASLTLAPKPAAVQSVADQVAQLASRDGGFVRSSHVSLQHGSSGEANLQLSLPSARLTTALAELGRLAPARGESQSLQDITDVYDADRAKLADAVAERQALLRALAKASTQGQIESLHARLALAAAAITRARNEYQAVSKRGSNSSVEVTVLGDAHADSSESTLSKALHEAGDVLKGALAVAIVALAVLVPLAILLVLLALGWRMTRRRLRERALS